MRQLCDRLGLSRSTLKRRLDNQIRAVERALRGAEDGTVEQSAEFRGTLGETLLSMHRPDRMPNKVIQLFLAITWLVPTARTLRFHLARPHGDDPWLCAFSSLMRYDTYRRAADPGWQGEPLRLRGGDIVRELHQHCATAGVLCDPPDAMGGPVERTFTLPSSLVAELANRA